MFRFSELVTFVYCTGFALGLQIPKRTVTSQYTNSTSTQASSQSTGGGELCCFVYPQLVALNFWYTPTVEINNGTVVTEYLKYNNTVVPTATVTIPINSTIDIGFYVANGGYNPTISGVPTDLAGILYDGQYDATSVLTGSLYDDGVTTIASPTPFMAYSNVYIFAGQLDGGGTCTGTVGASYNAETVTYTRDGITSTTYYPATTEVMSTYVVKSEAGQMIGEAGEAPLTDFFDHDVTYTRVSLSTPYYEYVTDTSTWNQQIVGASIGPEMFSWLAKNPSVLSIFPNITKCVAAGANGAPTVHIQVSLLTSTSSRTMTTNAIYTDTGKSTSAVPASKTPSAIPTATTTKPLMASTTKPQETTASSSIIAAGSTTASSSDIALSHVPSTSHESNPSSVANPEQVSSGSGQGDDASTSPKLVGSSSPDDSPTKTSAQVPEGSSNMESGETPTIGNSQPSATDENGNSHPISTSNSDSDSDSDDTGAPNQPVATVGTGSHVLKYASGSSSNIIVASKSLLVGGSAVTVSGDTISLASSGVVVVNGVSTPLNIPTSTPAPIVIDSITATALLSGGYAIGSKTISAGGSAVEISGTTYSILPSGDSVLVNEKTLPVSMVASSVQTHVQIEDITATPISSGIYVAEGKTLIAGGSAVEISGTTYSLPTSGNNVVVNGQTSSISIFEASPVVVGDITATALSSGAYVVAGKTLVRGGSAVDISGTTYSLPPSGSNVIIDGKTSPITPQASPVIFDDVTATPIASNAYIIAGQTLSPSGPAITISGTTYSLGPSDNSVIVNGKPHPINPSTPTTSAILLGDTEATPLPSSAYLLASQTLQPGGPALTISGTTYSLPASGTSVFINNTPLPISAASEAITLGSEVLTPAPAPTALVFGDKTLLPGSVITINSVTLSFPTAVSNVFVVDGEATTFAAGTGKQSIVVASQTLGFSQLASGVVVAGHTLVQGGAPVVVDGETLVLSGSALVEMGGGLETTVGLGGYIWRGIGGAVTSEARGAGTVTSDVRGTGTGNSNARGTGTTSQESGGSASTGSGTTKVSSLGASNSGTQVSGTEAVAASTSSAAADATYRIGGGGICKGLAMMAVVHFFF